MSVTTNHQRVYRIYRELELNLRIKPRKRIIRAKPEPLAVPESVNERWSTDFMHDQLADGRSYRLFNVIDDFNREASAKVIRSDNGPEYISATLMSWAQKHGIRLEHIQPGKPQQNAYVERYNRTVRYDWLGHYLFDSIAEVQEYATEWTWTYNNERPNMGLGGITPKQQLARSQMTSTLAGS